MKFDELVEFNEWWKTASVRKELALDYKRKLFYEIVKYLDTRQILCVVGLRRTGKTTLLYQLIDLLINKKVLTKKILYFSFDEKITELKEIITLYKTRTGIDFGKEQCFIFLDEIQKLEDWQDKIKRFYDLYPKLKFIISGSASLKILLKAKESLAGRIFYFYTDVLSFEEFLELKKQAVGKIKKDPELWKRELNVLMEEYFLKAFPEIVFYDEAAAKKYIKESVVESAIFKDILQLFGTKDLTLIKKLINLIAKNPGMTINMDDLSKDFGKTRQLISNYLYYLEFSFLIYSVRNFRGSFKAASRKLVKYYPIHPSLCLAFDFHNEGKIAESLVAAKIKPRYYWRELNKEVDFIVVKNNKPFPVEVKYKNKIFGKDIKHMIKFMVKFKVDEGLVITKDYEAEEKIKGKKINFIPLWKWLLK